MNIPSLPQILLGDRHRKGMVLNIQVRFRYAPDVLDLQIQHQDVNLIVWYETKNLALNDCKLFKTNALGIHHVWDSRIAALFEEHCVPLRLTDKVNLSFLLGAVIQWSQITVVNEYTLVNFCVYEKNAL